MAPGLREPGREEAGNSPVSSFLAHYSIIMAIFPHRPHYTSPASSREAVTFSCPQNEHVHSILTFTVILGPALTQAGFLFGIHRGTAMPRSRGLGRSATNAWSSRGSSCHSSNAKPKPAPATILYLYGILRASSLRIVTGNSHL